MLFKPLILAAGHLAAPVLARPNSNTQATAFNTAVRHSQHDWNTPRPSDFLAKRKDTHSVSFFNAPSRIRSEDVLPEPELDYISTTSFDNRSTNCLWQILVFGWSSHPAPGAGGGGRRGSY